LAAHGPAQETETGAAGRAGRARLRILILAIAGRINPAARYRAYALAPFRAARGHAGRVLAPLGTSLSRRGLRRLARPLDLLRDLALLPAHDAVVVQRKTFPRGTGSWLRRLARCVVYDLDDAVWLPAPSEPQGAVVAARYRAN